MHKNQDNELDWVAFQYVAGELNADESELFEARLADDQAAREAVARAVDLTHVTLLACEQRSSIEPAVAAHRDWARPVAWTFVGAAATIAALILLAPWLPNAISPNSTASTDRSQVKTPREGRDLAMTWAMARSDLSMGMSELNDAADFEEDAPSRVNADSADPADLADVIESSADDLETPSWMLIAVAGLMQDADAVPQGME